MNTMDNMAASSIRLTTAYALSRYSTERINSLNSKVDCSVKASVMSVVRGQLIAQATKATATPIRCLLAQLAHFADEGVDLLLLLEDGLVELLHQILGEAGLDFKVHQAFVNVGVRHVNFVI